MAERGVIYTIWGNEDRLERALDRSRRSLANIHPELPVEVFRIEASDPYRGLLEKSRTFAQSPFRETLALDIDTVVLGKLDFGFSRAHDFGIACCICECPWARRYAGLRERRMSIEYNTGVVFFTTAARPVFEIWQRLAQELDSSMRHILSDGKIGRMPFNDQAAFAAAIEECKFNPSVLPLNWNFRPQLHYSFFGPIVIWHDYADVPRQIAEINRYYDRADSIIQFHAVVAKA